MNLSKTKKIIAKRWELYLLLLLIAIGLFLRFYNYPYRYNLNDESVRDAAVATTGVREIQLPLIGPFSSAGPFTFGPWYYYQLVLARSILPIAYSPWIYLSLSSLGCILIAYKIGELLLNKKLGLILAFLLSISPSLILAGTHLTNPNLSNLFAFLAFYLFLRLLKKDHSYWWGFLFGLVIGIAVNIHYQMMGLLIFPLLLFAVKPRVKILLFCVMGFVVSFLPMIFFDLNNHLFNFKNIYYYYTEGKKLIYVPNRWLFYLRDFWPSYIEEVTGLPMVLGTVAMLIYGCFTVKYAIKRKLSSSLILLIIAFSFNFILLRYYWGERFFGYLNYLRPFIIIFEGLAIYYVLRAIKNRTLKVIISCFIVVLILFFNGPKILNLLKKDEFTQHIYTIKGKLLEKYPNEKFSVYICPGPGNTYYSSQENSLLFLLDRDNLLSVQGRPITFINDDCFPTGVRRNPYYKFEDANFIKIDNTDLIDLSMHSIASISAMGWDDYSLKKIHDTTTRWWFGEQP